MKKQRYSKLFKVRSFIAAAYLLTALFTVTALSGTALAGPHGKKVFEFDVCENIYMWEFDRAGSPVLDLADVGYPEEAGPPYPGSEGPPWLMPLSGNPFYSQGYVYPYGFLDDNDGILSDGSPAAPEKVIGIFTVRGYFIGDSVFAETGPWTTCTVHIVFFDETGWEQGKLVGNNTFTVMGYELSDIDLPYQMAVTGGTGRYRNLGGQATVINLGMGAYSNQRLRYSIKGNK